jgi:hypothetical protein
MLINRDVYKVKKHKNSKLCLVIKEVKIIKNSKKIHCIQMGNEDKVKLILHLIF